MTDFLNWFRGVLLIGASCSLLGLVSCSALMGPSWQKTYKNSALIFTVQPDSNQVVWNRARAWFSGYNRPGLDTITDNLILSSVTKSGGGSYTISVARRPMGKVIQFTVDFSVFDDREHAVADRAADRAHELAYLAATGDTERAFIIRSSTR